MPDDLTTYCENTWCPGCGNFGLFNSVKKAIRQLEGKGVARSDMFMCAGIGCHGKIFDYLAISGFYGLHGRSMATAQGVKLANPSLRVFAFCGDGDAYGEGMAHMLFAAKRNAGITVIVHNNGVYGLTVGQFTPVSKRGFKGPSSPRGNVEEPLNPLALMLEAGATFVARGYSGKPDHLTDIFARAMTHEGFAYVDVLQPCVSFNDTYKLYNESVEIIGEPSRTREEALAMVKRGGKIPIGVFWDEKREPYHRALLGERNQVRSQQTREDRQARVKKLLEG
ncbi:MAG: thiamine pyrophosphate-dependent enzyme [Methanobacteriota archaeon]